MGAKIRPSLAAPARASLIALERDLFIALPMRAHCNIYLYIYIYTRADSVYIYYVLNYDLTRVAGSVKKRAASARDITMEVCIRILLRME